MKITTTTERFEGVRRSRTFRNLCEHFGLASMPVLDVGCGQGQYLAHFGQGSIGITTTQEEVDFGKAHNLNIAFGNAERLPVSLPKNFKAIWANNLFEHLLSPHAFLMNVKRFSDKDALVIIGVPMVPKMVSLIRLRWWRGVLASNHVNFFTHTTLRLTIERAGWDTVEVRPFIFKNSFLDAFARPFAPHIYVVGRNNTQFKYQPKKLNEWRDDEYYRDMLAITHQTDE